jgi:fibro-slime domain-containing protein
LINKTSKVAARSLTAIALIVMIIISCISAVAVNKSVAESGAKKEIEVTGGTMTKGVDYYLVGDMCSPIWSTADTSFALTKVNGDNNHYTGTFRLTGQKTYEFKIYNSNGDYYSKSGASFSEGTQIVRGLTNDAGASNMSFVIPAGTTEITVDMYCEYSNDSQVTFTLNNLGTGDVTQGGTGHSYKAQSGVINHSSDTELLNVKSTFFDYYNDEEVDGSWRTSLSGFYRTVKSGNTSHNREPYEKFNRAIAQYANGVNNSSWTTPLYFGDFNTDKDGYQKDGYAGYGVSNLKKFLSVPNNSNATSSGTSGSVAGLADVTLADNKKLSKNGVTMPYFDEDWLVNNGYGTVVHSDFPMRKTTDKHGQDYYEYDSLNGKDNCYFDGYENLASGGNLTMNYAGGKSNSVYDALSGFSKSTINNPGFFPFDRQKDHSNNGYDFGFGMRLDLDFTLGANGKTNGEDTVFNFSGDDDLWVYLDGVLVLDMGGDHKMSQGCIDFTTLKSYVNNIDTTFQGSDLVYKNSSDKSGYSYSAEFPALFSDDTETRGSSKFNNNNVNAHHTLTVFYMERGMIESNLKVGFNFEPITDSLDVTKTVDTSNVNPKLQTAVKNADDFGFAIQENGADVSNKKYKYSDNGTINNAKTNGNTATLSDGDSASFNSQFAIDNNLTVTEGTPKKTIISNMDTDSLIYLDTKDMSCSWFFNNGAVPAISFDNGNTFHQMFSYQTDGRTIYYYESEKDSSSNKSFIIGRKDDMGVWNRVRFSAITENTNCINVKAWRSTSTGDISVVDNSGSISEVTKFALTPPSSGDYTIDTTKESLLAGHYNTNWSLYDVSGTSPDLITTGDTKVSNFKYKNKADDDLVSTHLRLDYVNTPQVANIKVNKNVVDKSGNTITDDDTQFDVTLKLDINGDGAYQDYGLTGKISQSSPYTFTGIPVGVKYKVEEHTPSGYKVSYGTVNTTNTGILGNAGATVDVINTVTPASITAGITKTLDRMFYDGSTFQFKLVGLASTTVGGVTTEDTSSVTDTISTVDDGNAAFNSIDYSTEGTYLYKITEEPLVDGHDYQTDSSVYIFKVVVAKDNGVLKATGTYYRGASSQSVEEIVDANNTTNIASFKNTSTKAQATVLKADKVNPDGTVPADAKKLEGAEFTLYKVDADRSKDNMVKVATATTDSNGEITFTDLDIFKSGKNGNGGTKEYQWYYVVETASAEGYTLSTNEQWFSFDGGHYDSTKNVYTHSFAALNTLITVPYAGINYLMQHNFILYGTLVLGLGAICSCGYMLRKRRLGAKAPTNKHGRK